MRAHRDEIVLRVSVPRAILRIDLNGQTGRIIVLAANPRTARGFAGDLILDEFAFHEDSNAIWDAAEPIISSNPDFLCRISSTGNGKRNMFYQLISRGAIPYYRVRRSDAWNAGEIKIYSAVTGRPITPDQAREESADKRSYDQNYECLFNDEAGILLTQELIALAECDDAGIEEQAWSDLTIARLARIEHPLYLGCDVARSRDFSVICVIAKAGQTLRTAAMLRMDSLRLPAQQAQLKRVCELPNLRRAEIDMTGIGLGLVEYSQDEPGWGRKVHGVNFAATEPLSQRIQSGGRKAPTARVTEIMATELLGAFEDRRITIPRDPKLRDDLRKPEKITSPGGRVSIAAARDTNTGHADHFWALALALRATGKTGGTFTFFAFPPRPGSRQEAKRSKNAFF